MEDCLFCKIVAGEIPSTRVHEDDDTVAFMDINPVTRGHLLVVPRRHSADITEVADDDLAACLRTARLLATKAMRGLDAEGAHVVNNCGAAAGQTVFHFHVHVVPRTRGDGFRIPLGGAAGDPAELEAAAEAIRAA